MRKRYSGISTKPVAIVLTALVLAGCASFSPDGGMDAVSDLTRDRVGHPVQRVEASMNEDVRRQVAELTAAPLTADAAMRIALVNNRGLQASLLELGVAEADLVQAGRLRNPGFSFGRLRGGDDVEIDRSIMFDLAGLLTMPVRSGIERRRFEQAKLAAATEAVRLAADTRRAYFEAVAAQQTVLYMQSVRDAAEAGAELAQRLRGVGNWSRLDQAREQVFYSDAVTRLARARHNAAASRERLTRLMGLWGEQAAAYRLPERLPELPKLPAEATGIESKAMEQRLDLLMARRDAEATASALGLTRATAFVNVFEAGYVNKSETGKPRSNGYEVSLELPLFDWGSARVAKAEARYMQTVHRTADAAIRARSEVREAYSAYRTTYDLAKHYRDDVVPLRKSISEEVMLRYNGMLAGVFELLADAREQVDSVNSAIEAQRDFWIADTDLQAAINGSGGGVAPMRTQAAAAAAPAEH